MSAQSAYGYKGQDSLILLVEHGGYLFNTKSNRIHRQAELDIKNGNVLTGNLGNFYRRYYNNTGKVWYVNSKTRALKTLQLSTPDKLNYVDMERYHVVHDSRGIIWISTYGNGLFAYDTLTEELQHFDFQIDGFSHISSQLSAISHGR